MRNGEHIEKVGETYPFVCLSLSVLISLYPISIYPLADAVQSSLNLTPTDLKNYTTIKNVQPIFRTFMMKTTSYFLRKAPGRQLTISWYILTERESKKPNDKKTITKEVREGRGEEEKKTKKGLLCVDVLAGLMDERWDSPPLFHL